MKTNVMLSFDGRNDSFKRKWRIIDLKYNKMTCER